MHYTVHLNQINLGRYSKPVRSASRYSYLLRNGSDALEILELKDICIRIRTYFIEITPAQGKLKP